MKEQNVKTVTVNAGVVFAIAIGSLGIAYGLGYRNAMIECATIMKAFTAGYESCSKFTKGS